jgi:hypothetical protein
MFPEMEMPPSRLDPSATLAETAAARTVAVKIAGTAEIASTVKILAVMRAGHSRPEPSAISPVKGTNRDRAIAIAPENLGLLESSDMSAVKGSVGKVPTQMNLKVHPVAMILLSLGKGAIGAIVLSQGQEALTQRAKGEDFLLDAARFPIEVRSPILAIGSTALACLRTLNPRRRLMLIQKRI